MKKALCLILSLVMILAAFAGCGKSEKSSTTSEVFDPSNNKLYDSTIKLADTGGLSLPLAAESETITWLVTSSVDTVNDSWFAQKLRGATGLDVQLQPVPPSAVADKYSTLVASKSLPDISSPPNDNIAQDLCDQGAFAAVEDYIDYLPNFKRTFVDNKENNWIFDAYKSSDGKLYPFFGFDWQRDLNTGVAMYRKDIFDKHGLTMWNSTEEFYETLKKLKELYPDSTPLAQKTTDGTFGTFAKHWGLKAHDASFIEEKNEWIFTDTSDEYRNVLDFMKKLYDEGLIDPEFLTATQAAWTSRMTQADKAFVTIDWIGRMSMFDTQTDETVPDYDLRFANPIGPDQKYEQTNQLCWGRHVSNNKKAKTAFKLLDFVLSPAGKQLLTMGVEGETFTIGEDGMADYVEFPDHIPSINELEEKYGMFIEQVYLSFDRRSSYFEFTPAEQEAQDFMKDPAHVRPFDPVLSFTAEEKEENNDILADLMTAGKEFATQYVLGTNTGDAAWEAWKNKAKALGADKLVENYKAAYARMSK